MSAERNGTLPKDEGLRAMATTVAAMLAALPAREREKARAVLGESTTDAGALEMIDTRTSLTEAGRTRVPAGTLRDAVNLADIIRAGIPPVEFLTTPTLGDRAFYRAGTILIGGHPKEGKSWLLVALVLDFLATTDRPVIVWDFENGPSRFARRLVALSADLGHVERIKYVKFPRVARDTYEAELRAIASEYPGAMLAVDSLRGLLGKLGREENDAGDIEQALNPLNEAAEDGGLSVPILDHVPKDGSSGDRYPGRGSGAKLAVVSSAYYVEKVDPFSAALEGAIKLHVKADRDGELPAVLAYKVGGGGERFSIRQVNPSEVGAGGQVVDAVLDFIRDAAGPVTKSEIKKGVRGTETVKVAAADKLAAMEGSGVHRVEFTRPDATGRDRALNGYEYDPGRNESYKSGGLGV